MAKSARKTGSQRMQEQGFRQVVLWLTEVEWEVCRRVAKDRGKPISTTVREDMFGVHATNEERLRNMNYRK